MYALSCFDYSDQINAAEWACNNRIMPHTNRLFSFEPSPYFEEPTIYASDLASTCRIIVKTPAQCGKSTLLENFIAWVCLYDPSPSLLIMDTSKNAQNYSKTRLKPFLRDVVHLGAFDERTADNRTEDKIKEVFNFSIGPNANLMLGGSASASDLCSRPIKYLICDELDRWTDQIRGEGDPLLLALKRTMRFRGIAIFASTPTDPDNRISAHYRIGTMQSWGVICSVCGQWMPVLYDDIKWDGVPNVSCKNCGQCYNEQEIISLKHAYCKPQNEDPFIDKFGRIARSYEVTAPLCHAFYTWNDLRNEEKQALKLDDSAVQTFRNVTLGEAYVPPEIKRQDPLAFTAFRKNYTLQSVPEYVEYVFGGSDTQDNMIALELIGVSADGMRICGLGYYTFPGEMGEPGVWQAYLKFVQGFSCTTTDGRALQVSMVFQDSGGHYTNAVYNMPLFDRRIRPVKGRAYAVEGTKLERALVERVTYRQANTASTAFKVPVVHIGTVFGKDIVLAKLNRMLYDDKFDLWQWSDDLSMGYDAIYFGMLCSNYCINTKFGHRYELAAGEHDEALDCRVYAMAAAEYFRQWTGKTPEIQAMRDIILTKSDAARERLESLQTVQAKRVTAADYEERAKEIPIPPIQQKQLENEPQKRTFKRALKAL